MFKPLNDTVEGEIPPPIVTLTPKESQMSYIAEMKGVLSNFSVLQSAAKQGGFLNSDFDSDGELRSTNLVYIYKDGVYPSLALQATRSYLLTESTQFVTTAYDDSTVLDGIQLDQFVIPTNEEGGVLIPFRGGPYTFPYFSATDILENRVASADIAGKLIFVGATATGLGDLQPTAVASEYPGVEVHATVSMANRIEPFLAINFEPLFQRKITYLALISVDSFPLPA